MAPLKKAQGFKKSACHIDEAKKGLFEKGYVCSERTGRPNQVFICLVCQARRPKLTKILKHLNVHLQKDKPKKETKSTAVRHQGTFKLPSMSNLFQGPMH